MIHSTRTTRTLSSTRMPEDHLVALLSARHHDPFQWLGLHAVGDKWVLRLLRPHLVRAHVVLAGERIPMQRVPDTDLFEATFARFMAVTDYHFETQDDNGNR